MTVLIICDVRGGMSPGKCVTAGKSGNSKKKKRGGKKTQGTSEVGGMKVGWRDLWPLSLSAAPFEPLKGVRCEKPEDSCTPPSPPLGSLWETEVPFLNSL